MYTITERKMVNGEKVESVRPLSDKEYEVHHKLVLVFMLVCIYYSNFIIIIVLVSSSFYPSDSVPTERPSPQVSGEDQEVLPLEQTVLPTGYIH